MIVAAVLLQAAAVAASPAAGLTAADFERAVSVCEAWMERPALWTSSPAGFARRAKFDQAGLAQVQQIPAYVRETVKPSWGDPYFWALRTNGGTIWISTYSVDPICNIQAGDSPSAARAAEAYAAGYAQKADWVAIDTRTPGSGTVNRTFERHKQGRTPRTVISTSYAANPTDGAGLQAFISRGYKNGN